MADEEGASGATTTEEGTTTEAGTSAAPAGGSSRAGGRPAKLPRLLEEGAQDAPEGTKDEQGNAVPRWITYLQQMLNYHYQTEVVPTSGDFEWLTARAVSHFREQNELGEGAFVDIPFWSKLGVEDAPDEQPGGQHNGQQGGQGFSDVDWGVSPVDLADASVSWAASMAIVLNTREGDLTVERLCERAGVAVERKSWHEAQTVGLGCGMYVVTCHGAAEAEWAGILNQHGPLWVPNPNDEYHVVVVAGVVHDGDHAAIHVLDPARGSDQWLPFSDFVSSYGITEGYQGELLALG
jgi:hypothetical protein